MDALERILDLKNKRGLSDLEFEREMQLSLRIVAGWKGGKSKSYMDIIPQLADYFNVSADYLLGLTDDPTPRTAPAPSSDQEARIGRAYTHATEAEQGIVERVLAPYMDEKYIDVKAAAKNGSGISTKKMTKDEHSSAKDEVERQNDK